MKLLDGKKLIGVMFWTLLYQYICFSDIKLKRDFMEKYELSQRKYFHRSICLLTFKIYAEKKNSFFKSLEDDIASM